MKLVGKQSNLSMAALLAITSLSMLLSSPAEAKETKEYTNYVGFYPGDVSDTELIEGVYVSFEIRDSTLDDHMYVRGEFCNARGSIWEGGIRVTDEMPLKAHTTLRIAPGDCGYWSEHLQLGSYKLYILVDEND